MIRVLRRLLWTAALVAAALAVWTAHGATAPDEDLLETLTCPDCAGLPVEESPAPMAAAFRAEARARLADGSTIAEVRAWFAERYGDQVLLAPEPGGAPLSTWVAGFAALAGTGLVLAGRRRRPSPGPTSPSSAPAHARADLRGTTPAQRRPRARRPVALRWQPGATALVVAGACALATPALVQAQTRDEPKGAVAAGTDAARTPGRGTGRGTDLRDELRVELRRARRLERSGRFLDAAATYRRVLDEVPGGYALRTRMAYDLFRAGRHGQAARAARAALRRSPDDRDARLVLEAARKALDERRDGNARREGAR